MSKKYVQRVQDNVHGLMEFRGMETAVIGLLATPEMQRLGRVQQLGLADLVYPGAEHSRHAHSLGAAYLAVRIGRRLCDVASEFLGPLLQPGPLAVRDLAIAALCHDLGHGPFSHAWEHECIGKKFNRPAWCAKLGLCLTDTEMEGIKWHELVTLGLLGWKKGTLHKKLEEHELGTAERIQGFLRGVYHIPYLPRLISSDLDVDRGDFLLRDSIQTGATYGRYELDWLLSNTTLGYHKDQLVVGFDKRKSRRAFEQFILARRALYETVYYHHTVKGAEVMMGVIFKRLKKLLAADDKSTWEGFKGFEPIVRVAQGEALSQEEVLTLDDPLLWSFIQRLAYKGRELDYILSDLAGRLVQRKLYKEVYMGDKANSIPLHYKAMERARDRINESSDGDPITMEEVAEYYYFHYRTDDELLSRKESESSFFIDASRPSRPATLIRDDKEFLPVRMQSVITDRLYVADEAREAVQDALSG